MATIGDLGAELNLLCRRGHTIGPFELTWVDDVGAPINLATATFTNAIYRDKKDLTVLDTFDISVVNAALGIFSIVLSSADSAALPITDKLFYIVSVTISGNKIPLVYGLIDVRAS